MDGKGNLRNRKPSTWSAETWQAIALFAVAALLLTNAAWFHTMRTERAESADRLRLAGSAAAVPIQAARPPQELELPSVDAIPPITTGQRCIDGQRFQRIANGWVQAGHC